MQFLHKVTAIETTGEFIIIAMVKIWVIVTLNGQAFQAQTLQAQTLDKQPLKAQTLNTQTLQTQSLKVFNQIILEDSLYLYLMAGA